jgi:hypothetical protein
MKRMDAVALVALSAALVGAAPATRHATPERVRVVLRGHEHVRMTAAEWRSLGDDVDVRLAEAAADPALVFGARQRALSALATVGGPRAEEFLHRFVTGRDAPAPLLASAIDAYARGFGRDNPDEALRLASALVTHPDWQVRRGAVRALGGLRGDAARSVLRDRQAREPHPAVGSAIRSALQAPPAR